MDAPSRFSPEYDPTEKHRRHLMFAVLLVGVLAIVGTLAWAYWPREPLPDGARADRVVVRKEARTLSLYDGAALLRTYRIALGGDPEGDKERLGDGKTPEGRYVLDYRNPHGAFHKSIHISYPSVEDRFTASEQGVDPGGLIMVHGVSSRYEALGRLHSLVDWTAGCIAVSSGEMDEIWRVVADGTPIIIEP